jgi:hypothetical protein
MRDPVNRPVARTQRERPALSRCETLQDRASGLRESGARCASGRHHRRLTMGMSMRGAPSKKFTWPPAALPPSVPTLGFACSGPAERRMNRAGPPSPGSPCTQTRRRSKKKAEEGHRGTPPPASVSSASGPAIGVARTGAGAISAGWCSPAPRRATAAPRGSAPACRAPAAAAGWPPAAPGPWRRRGAPPPAGRTCCARSRRSAARR